MKIVATIEARMGSSRLPGKSLKKILNKPLLQFMIERVKKTNLVDEIIIATSINSNNDPIENLSKSMDVTCFRGSEDDVLKRVLDAAESSQGDIILELWGDCPLIDPKILDELLSFYLENNFDCVGTVLPNFPKKFPLGISALVFSTKILKEVNELTQNPDDRENVSNYIYEHPEKYSLASLPCPDNLNHPELRLVVDEQDDFNLVKKILETLYPENQNFSTSDIIDLIKSSPDIVKINENVVQRRLKVWDTLLEDN